MRPLMIASWRFTLIIAVTILVLGVLNALPQFLGGEPLGVVRYDSYERLATRHSGHAWRPPAVPAPWAWPPSTIRVAFGRPDWVEFVFDSGAGSTDPLIVCATVSDASGDLDAIPSVLLPAGELLQESDESIDGRAVRLRRLLLANGTMVHELWWHEGARRVMLRLHGAADRLPDVAPHILGNGR